MTTHAVSCTLYSCQWYSGIAFGKWQLSYSLSSTDLEWNIMGHMAGSVTIYKPYLDMEWQLDSCKEKVSHFRQQNCFQSEDIILLVFK
ncbi:hypothetical protein OUZ56_011368 [Daphnia magna]|uniref:Uncharacterized protein n=1 Tax=Daphnia magna TaxID=35525 RepID=A0ABQ9Z0B2_9CRUS|nr:hypothetical protein OUZ56_011368 [Daphnia magna]